MASLLENLAKLDFLFAIAGIILLAASVLSTVKTKWFELTLTKTQSIVFGIIGVLLLLIAVVPRFASTPPLNSLPAGTIVAWSPTDTKTQNPDFPNGWALCDGSNGTPDLRNRFLLGSGTADAGKRGGSEEFIVNNENFFKIELRGSFNADGDSGGRRVVTDGEEIVVPLPPYAKVVYIMKLPDDG